VNIFLSLLVLGPTKSGPRPGCQRSLSVAWHSTLPSHGNKMQWLRLRDGWPGSHNLLFSLFLSWCAPALCPLQGSDVNWLLRITAVLNYADCANNICQGDNNCPVCGSHLDGANVSVEVIGDSNVLLSLRGSSPEEIIMVPFSLFVDVSVPENTGMKVNSACGDTAPCLLGCV
jgi:hypothetical protein